VYIQYKMGKLPTEVGARRKDSSVKSITYITLQYLLNILVQIAHNVGN
jgi:hypothetical protein